MATKYMAHYSWKPEIEKINVERETDSSVWIKGRQRQLKNTTYYGTFDTFAEAKEFPTPNPSLCPNRHYVVQAPPQSKSHPIGSGCCSLLDLPFCLRLGLSESLSSGMKGLMLTTAG